MSDLSEHVGGTVWFGDPWPSLVCYDETGRLRTELRTAQPAPARRCMDCEEPFIEGEGGVAFPLIGPELSIVYAHKECFLMSVLGSLAHVERRCACFGGEAPADDREGRTMREEALAVWSAAYRRSAQEPAGER